MGYKDLDNNGNFVKIQGDEGEEDEPAQASKAHTLGQIMDVLAELQISVGHINSRFDRMDEHLDSLGAQVADIRRIMDFRVSAEEIHGDPVQSRSSEATQSPSHA